MQVVIVKRGEFSTFRMLSDQFAADPEVHIIWDRRTRQDRRSLARPVPTDARQQQRRRGPDALWATMGYTIVNISRGEPNAS